MPHKHKRQRVGDSDLFELPPSTLAKPLPVIASRANIATLPPNGKRKPRKKQAGKEGRDDTPRAFARLMAYKNGIKPHSGLDTGETKSKKIKSVATSQATKLQRPCSADHDGIPKIMPGERMGDYAARVDAALPVRGLVNKTRDLPGVKKHPTWAEKKMHRIQNEWRVEEARRKDKLQEQLDDALIDDDSHGVTRMGQGGRRKRKRSQFSRLDEDNPWAAIEKSRRREKPSGDIIGLHDVVNAPPELKKPKERFRNMNGALVDVMNVPASAGSLRRREELEVSRTQFVEDYRNMTNGRKGTALDQHSSGNT